MRICDLLSMAIELGVGEVAAQQALAADRFAREIVAILACGFDGHLISIYLGGG